MGQPAAYSRTKNFQENASSLTDHGALNSELDKVSLSIGGIRTNLALIQDDDGTLASHIVQVENLAPAAIAALQSPGPAGSQGPAGAQGAVGPAGAQGPKGDTGASFNADVRDLYANRALYNAQPKGFSFFALDTGNLYFKLSNTSADWSGAYVFGKGDTGAAGAVGAQGAAGPQGIQGVKGDKGDTGAAGPAGPQGPAAATVDTATKTASLIGKSSVSVRLAIVAGVLTIVLETS